MSDIPPRLLTRDEAARYLGVSATTFEEEVAAGLWPAGQRRGAKGGKVTWDRRALDLAADRLSGITAPADEAGHARLASDAEAQAMERARHGSTAILRR